MIELYLVKTNQLIEIPTISIKLTGQRFKAARKITADILYTDAGGLQYTKVEEGNTLLFKWKGKELFRGTVFSRTKTKKGTLNLIAYDLLQYLIANKDVYVFSKQRADQIVTRICRDFEIPMGTIANTGTSLNEVYTNETTLYDIILRALVNTEKANGRKFQLTSKEGKLNLTEWKSSSEQWVLETGVNLIDYTYTTSIEETATRVKLVSGEDKKTITATVTDSDGKKKYGVLQYFERVDKKLNQGQLNTRASNILKEKKGVQKKLDVSAIGIPDIVSGMPIYVIENDIGVKGTYYVDSDNHSFEGDYHQMDLTLLEKNTMAVVD